MTRRLVIVGVLCVVICGAAMACGPSPERPLLTATGLKFHKPGVSGLPVDVTYHLQNPNAEPLSIERFDYEVLVNGHSIGRGFVPDALRIEAFKEQQVVSRFNINYFSIPGAVKQVLDQDKINATIRGTFYLNGRFRTTQLPYESTGVIPLGHDGEPKRAPAVSTPVPRTPSPFSRPKSGTATKRR